MSWQAHLRGAIGPLSVELDVHGDRTPTAVIGPNGSGKTTFLRMIVGAHPPDRGHIEVRERTFFSSSAQIDVPIDQRCVGYVPQGYGLFPHLNVVDNVAFGLSIQADNQPANTCRDQAMAMLEQVGCAGLADRRPDQISGGQSQRIALARALVIDPTMLLLDEPLAALDAIARRKLRAVIADRLRAADRPAIVVTHDVRDVSAFGASICAIEHGRVVQRGSLDAIRRAPATDFVAEFVAADR